MTPWTTRTHPDAPAPGGEDDMRWKRIGLAAFLAPALGCHTGFPNAHELINDKLTVCSEAAITQELRHDARLAWREVRCQYPRHLFSPEFREGFLDGYTDYLDRGGSGSLPVVPPAHLTRSKRYYSPEGQARLKDYFLGFQYGTDVAIATGCRQFLTVPVLLPEKDRGAPSFHVPAAVPTPVGTAVRPPAAGVSPEATATGPRPLPLPRPMPTPSTPDEPLPVPMPPGPKPPTTLAPPDPDGSKFGPLAPTGPEIRLPPQNPPLPIPFKPTIASDTDPDAPLDTKFDPPPPTIRLPEPPPEVPSLPAGIPTPSWKDDLPVIAPNHHRTAPIPANHAPPGK